jgi:hypothetical protein
MALCPFFSATVADGGKKPKSLDEGDGGCWRALFAVYRRRLSRCGCSCQFGRASAPMIPHRVHTMRGAERWHWHVIGPRVCAHDGPVVALPARHVERPHSVGAHVAEGHWVAGWGSWSCAHSGEDTMAAFGESCRDSGHGFSSLFDPYRNSMDRQWCSAKGACDLDVGGLGPRVRCRFRDVHYGIS